MKQYRTRTISAFPPIALLLVSVGSLGFAFYAQYVQKLLPCVLCLYQRVPFYGVAGLSLLPYCCCAFPPPRGLLFICVALRLQSAPQLRFITSAYKNFGGRDQPCAAALKVVPAQLPTLRRNSWRSRLSAVTRSTGNCLVSPCQRSICSFLRH